MKTLVLLDKSISIELLLHYLTRADALYPKFTGKLFFIEYRSTWSIVTWRKWSSVRLFLFYLWRIWFWILLNRKADLISYVQYRLFESSRIYFVDNIGICFDCRFWTRIIVDYGVRNAIEWIDLRFYEQYEAKNLDNRESEFLITASWATMIVVLSETEIEYDIGVDWQFKRSWHK